MEDGLKKIGEVVLIPQPTDHPDDPLNWYGTNLLRLWEMKLNRSRSPLWKNAIMVVLGITVAVTVS
jgi:hypothetical protein